MIHPHEVQYVDCNTGKPKVLVVRGQAYQFWPNAFPKKGYVTVDTIRHKKCELYFIEDPHKVGDRNSDLKSMQWKFDI